MASWPVNEPPTAMVKKRMRVMPKNDVHLDDIALHKSKDNDDNDDAGSEFVECKAHAVGLKGPNAMSSEQAETRSQVHKQRKSSLLV